MSIYQLIALLLVILIFGDYYKLGESFKDIAEGMASLFDFSRISRNPVIQFAYICAFLLTFVGLVKIVCNRKHDDNE